MNNTNMSDKEIIKAARIAGIKLNSIKTTDLEGRFPPHIGGFSYDKEQIESLANFANEFVANMQKTIDEQKALIGHLKSALKSYVDNAKEIDLGGADCIVSTCESLEIAVTALGMDLTSPVSEKAK